MQNADQALDTVELGVASILTKGPIGPVKDETQGRFLAGLTDE